MTIVDLRSKRSEASSASVSGMSCKHLISGEEAGFGGVVISASPLSSGKHSGAITPAG